MFSFQTRAARDTILRGGPWTFNHSLLLLETVDDLIDPLSIPLRYQAFWVQVKGLPLVFMTSTMGKLIGEALGTYVATDQSRRGDCLGSYLRIRVLLDVGRPLRRWLGVRLPDDSGTTEWVQLRYEKLPVMCFLCGLLDHCEKDCGLYGGKEMDDRDKPYGLWFQHDVLGPDYRKPKGRRFGLSSSTAWSMRAPMAVDDKEMEEGEEPAPETIRPDVRAHGGDEQHAINAYDQGSGICGGGGLSEKENLSGSHLPDLNGPPFTEDEINAELGGPHFALFDHIPENDVGTQLSLSPLSREFIMTDICAPTTGPPMDPSFPLVNHGLNAPTSGIGSPTFSNDDPFNLSPIIRRLADQDRVDRGKRPSRQVRRRRRNGPRKGDTMNSNGKRNISMVARTECMQVEKRPCFSSTSSRSMIGSAVVGEAQPRREP